MTAFIKNHILRFPTQLLLIFIGSLLFIPFIGNVHLFDWDEINFAESAREMLLTGNYRMVQINFEPFYEKPPFFIWLQALSMHYFGVSEFAARLPNAICGILTMLVVFNVGRNVFQLQFGVLWSLLFAGSILPHVYFKSGIIDPYFNLLIFLGIFFIFKLSLQNDFENFKIRRSNRRWYLLLSALCIGLATLTKGPVAILLVVLTASVYFFANRGKLKIELSEMVAWWFVVVLIVVVWLSFEVRSNGLKFVSEFVSYQIRLFTSEDAGHGGPFFYHFIVLLIGVFPAAALIFSSFSPNVHDDSSQISFKKWMLYLLIVVLVVFSIVKTKIIHYSSLCYFPITFLAAYYLNHLIDKRVSWTWKQTTPLIFIGTFLVVSITGGIYLIQRPDVFINYVKDDFAKACLQATVYWSNNDVVPGFTYLTCIVIAILMIQTKHVKWGIYLLLISSTFFVSHTMTFVVPRVEMYTQAALIEFMKSKANEDCVIETAGFKSYAHFFYAQKKMHFNKNDKRSKYMVTKVNKVDDLKSYYPDLIELYRKNGWVFFKYPEL